MYLKKQCPLCKRKTLRKVSAIRRRVNLLVAIIFRPAWIITIIITYTDHKYKCDTCGKRFNKTIIED